MAIRALMPEKLDINSASMEQLAALKGIGEIYAAMINRERPYQTTNELIKKKAIPAAIYDQIKNDITAKQGVGEMAVQKP